MSKGLFANWRFRTSHPTLEPGQRIEVYLTAFDHETGRAEARIGDTVLTVDGASSEQVDELVEMRVEAFDSQQHTGTARVSPGP